MQVLPQINEFIKYLYDDNDRLLVIEYYDKDGDLSSFIENMFFGLDNLPDVELSFDASGQLLQKKN